MEEDGEDFTSSTESVLNELRKSYNNSHRIIERKLKTPTLFYREDTRTEDSEPLSPSLPEPKIPSKTKSNGQYIMKDRKKPVGLNPKDFLPVSLSDLA